MKNPIRITLGAVLLILVVIVIGVLLNQRQPNPPAITDVLTVSTAPSLTASLDIIANERGFFSNQGLKVNLKQFSSGAEAMAAMLQGQADIASSGTFSITRASFQRKDYKIIASVATLANDNQIVARKDAGIQQLADLKGKRIGVAPNTMAQYSLDLLLAQVGLSEKEVNVQYIDRTKLNEALISGTLDGICTMGAYVSQAKTALNENAVLLGNESLVKVTDYVAALDSTLQQKPLAVQKLLKGYIQAEEFIHNNPDEAINILSNFYKLDPVDTRSQWKTYRFHVGLDQSLIDDLEAIAQWQVDNKITDAPKIPNYMEYFYFQGLESIDKQRISIIH